MREYVDGRMRPRGKKIHSGAMFLVGWSHAAFGDQWAGGKYQLSYVIGLTSSSLTGPCHIIRRTSRVARKPVRGMLGGEISVSREMIDHMFLLREFH